MVRKNNAGHREKEQNCRGMRKAPMFLRPTKSFTYPKE